MSKKIVDEYAKQFFDFSKYSEPIGDRGCELKIDKNTRIYNYDHNNTAYLKNDIIIKAYVNGTDVLYDPKELAILYKNNENIVGVFDKNKVNYKNYRKLILKIIPPNDRCKVIVNSRNKFVERLLLTEEGMYGLIINSQHPEARFIKEELLHMIRLNREYQNKSFRDLLLNHSYTGLFESENKIIDTIYLEDKLRAKLKEFINDGTIFIRDAYQFPVIKGNVMVNEKIFYYIENLDKVKVHNKLDCYISAIKFFNGLASVLDKSDTSIRQKIDDDIYDHTIPMEGIDNKPYINIKDISKYLERLFTNSDQMLNQILNNIFTSMYDQYIKSPENELVVNSLVNSIKGYEYIEESYPINLYLEYKGYIETCNMSAEEAKNKILENYKSEII